MSTHLPESASSSTLTTLDATTSVGNPDLLTTNFESIEHERMLPSVELSADDLSHSSLEPNQTHSDEISDHFLSDTNREFLRGDSSRFTNSQLTDDILFANADKNIFQEDWAEYDPLNSSGNNFLIGETSDREDKIIFGGVSTDIAQENLRQVSSFQLPDSEDELANSGNELALFQSGLEIALYDTDSNTLIQTIENGAEISATVLKGKNVTLAASIPEDSPFSGQAKSIFLSLNNGQITKTEHSAPYALFGDAEGDFFAGKAIPSGKNTLSFDVYSERKLQGNRLGTVSLDFTILEDTATGLDDDSMLAVSNSDASLVDLSQETNNWTGETTDTVSDALDDNTTSLGGAEPPAVASTVLQSGTSEVIDIAIDSPADIIVVSTTASTVASNGSETQDLEIALYDAESDTLIQTITDGTQISASSLKGKKVTIAATVPEDSAFSGQARSAFLDLNEGQITKTENLAPYALFGDSKGDFFTGKPLPSGENTLSIDIYSKKRLKGDRLGTVSVDFEIVDDISTGADTETDSPTSDDEPSTGSGTGTNDFDPTTDSGTPDTDTPSDSDSDTTDTPDSPSPTDPPDDSTDDLDSPQTLGRWMPLNEPGTGGRIDSIAVNPHDSDVVLAGGDLLSAYRSTNQGLDWSATSGWLSYEISDFTWHPTEKDVVWAGSLSGPHLSTDGGKTWTAKREGLPEIESSKYSAPVEKILFDPDSGNLLAFGGDHRQLKSPGSILNYGAVWFSKDNGETWSQHSTIVENGNVMDVSYAAQSNQEIYSVVWEHGFFRSGDDGRTWQAKNRGLPRSDDGKLLVAALAVHPSNSDVAWVTIQNGGIYRTTNGGDSWAQTNQGLPSGNSQFWSIEVAADGQTLYAGNKDFRNQRGIYKSTDAGRTWTNVFDSNTQIEGGERPYPGGINPWWVEVDPNDADTIYTGTDNAIFRSVNGGESWQPLTSEKTDEGWIGTGFSGLVSRNIEWNPYNPEHVVVQGMDGAVAIQSWNGGQTWRVDNPGLPNFSGGHDVAFTKDWLFGVFGQSGDDRELIARSSDQGRSWTLLESPISPSEAKHLHVDSENPDKLWVVVGGQLWHTQSATKTTSPEWTRVRVGPFDREIGDIESDPRDNSTFYIATNEGIYHTTDGSTFKFIGGPMGKSQNIEINLAPSDPDIVYVTVNKSYWGDYGVWRYDASQDTWQHLWKTERDNSSRIGDLAVHPDNPDLLALVTNDQPYHDATWATGVWLSQDAGKTWTQHNVGLPMLRGRTIAFDPNGDNLIVGLGGAGFYKAEIVKQ